MLSIKNHIKGLKRAPNWLNDSDELIINLIELQTFGTKIWHLKPRNKGQLLFTGMIKITGLNGKKSCDSALQCTKKRSNMLLFTPKSYVIA